MIQIEELTTRDVLQVARAEIPECDAHGAWPCALCGSGYPVHDGWLVDYFHRPTREMARAYVCPACAMLLSEQLRGARH